MDCSGLIVNTAPSVEPVVVLELRAQLHLDTTEDDTWLATAITGAREAIELYLRRALISTTFDAHYPKFLAELRPPRPPLQSVTSITYTDSDGESQTLSSALYTVDTYSQPGRVLPAYGQSWPSTRAIPNAVRLRYVAGYGDAAPDVPAPIRLAVLMLAADLYEHREAQSEIRVEDNATYARILAAYRLPEVG